MVGLVQMDIIPKNVLDQAKLKPDIHIVRTKSKKEDGRQYVRPYPDCLDKDFPPAARTEIQREASRRNILKAQSVGHENG